MEKGRFAIAATCAMVPLMTLGTGNPSQSACFTANRPTACILQLALLFSLPPNPQGKATIVCSDVDGSWVLTETCDSPIAPLVVVLSSPNRSSPPP